MNVNGMRPVPSAGGAAPISITAPLTPHVIPFCQPANRLHALPPASAAAVAYAYHADAGTNILFLVQRRPTGVNKTAAVTWFPQAMRTRGGGDLSGDIVEEDGHYSTVGREPFVSSWDRATTLQ